MCLEISPRIRLTYELPTTQATVIARVYPSFNVLEPVSVAVIVYIVIAHIHTIILTKLILNEVHSDRINQPKSKAACNQEWPVHMFTRP